MNADRLMFQPVDWSVDSTSGANAINTATKAAVATKKHVTFGFWVTYSATVVTAHTIAYTDGVTTQTIQVPAATVTNPIWVDCQRRPRIGAVNTAVTVAVGAAGGAVVSSVNFSGYTEVAE